MFGPDNDYLIDSIIRAIAEHHGHEQDWPGKYGTNIDNETFMMHRFCWCEGEDCPWCEGCTCSENTRCEFCKNEAQSAPNFHYKPLDFKVWWYKYIGRSMKFNKSLTIKECSAMLSDCINLKK